MPEIPDSWSQAIAAVGAILVLVLFMRFTAELLKGQGKQSATLIDRAFDIADRIVTAQTIEVRDADAVQESSATSVDVRQSSGDGETLATTHVEAQAPAKASAKAPTVDSP